MAVATPAAKNTPLLELKSASLTMVALVLRSASLDALAHDLAERAAATPGLFDKDLVAIDLWRVRECDEPIDFVALSALLRSHNLVPVAARGGSAAQMAAAAAAGLAEAPDAPRSGARESIPPRSGARESILPRPRDNAVPLLTDNVREVQSPATPALIVERPLRSGQQVIARGRDLVVLALVSDGAELIADGSIHVYAPLRGRAAAGAGGDAAARIYCTCMQAQLLSIAGVHRTGEAALPPALFGHAVQVRLVDGELRVDALAR